MRPVGIKNQKERLHMKQTNRISKKLIALVAAAVMFVSAGAGAMHPSDRSYAPVVASAAALSQLGRLSTTVSSGAKSRNIGNHNYTWGARDTNTRNWADNSKSCLARNSDGTYTRAEYIDDKLVIETYTSAFSLKSTKRLPPPYWYGVSKSTTITPLLTEREPLKTSVKPSSLKA